jgi:hypothetical protein
MQIFCSDVIDENTMDCIIGRCSVLTSHEAACPDLMGAVANDSYVCTRHYNVATGTISAAVSCSCLGPTVAHGRLHGTKMAARGRARARRFPHYLTQSLTLTLTLTSTLTLTLTLTLIHPIQVTANDLQGFIVKNLRKRTIKTAITFREASHLLARSFASTPFLNPFSTIPFPLFYQILVPTTVRGARFSDHLIHLGIAWTIFAPSLLGCVPSAHAISRRFATFTTRLSSYDRRSSYIFCQISYVLQTFLSIVAFSYAAC